MPTGVDEPVGALPRRLRLGLIVALGAVTAVCWIYPYIAAADMAGMEMGGMATMAMDAAPKAWTAADALALLAMGWIMMAGMMLPSAMAMVLTFATINRRRAERGAPTVATAVFVAGYLLAWGGYSAAAVAAQWGLEQAALLSPMMVAISPLFGGALLIASGIYQFTPVKHACLAHCRSPMAFLLNRWSDGTRGALAMGVEHGLYCLGCC